MRVWRLPLVVGLVLLWAGVAAATPSLCTLSGTVTKADGSACASCNITIESAANQTIGGTVIPKGQGHSWKTDASGLLPAGVTAVRTEKVNLTIASSGALLRTIPDSSTENITTLILDTSTAPTSTDINAFAGILELDSGGSGSAGPWTPLKCVHTNAGGTAFEVTSSDCGSGGGGGASNSFETWTTSSGTSPVADSATDTMTFTGTAPIVATGSSAADSITLSCITAATGVKGCLSGADWDTFNAKVGTARAINTTAPLTGGGTLAGDLTIDCTAASTSVKGCLTSTDWNTFNGKQAGDGDLTALAALSGTGYAVRTGSNTWALQTIGGGYGIDASLVGAATSIAFDPVSVTGDVTWAGGGTSTLAWTFNVSGTDPIVTFGSSSVDVTTGTLKQNGTAVVLQSRNVNTTAPLTGGGALSGDLTLDCTAASTLVKGCLTPTDWNTFNGKQAAGSYQTVSTLLSSTNTTDTLTGTAQRGDVIIGNTTPKWSRLSAGIANTFFHSDGTDVGWKTIDLSSASGGTPDVQGVLPNANTTATASAGNSTIVARNSSGNFAAGTITASLTGDASLDAKLLGRSGGQTLIGGTASGDKLVLQSTSNGTKGSIDLDELTTRIFPSFPASTASTTAWRLLDFNPTTTLSNGAGGQGVYGLDMRGSYSVTTAAGTNIVGVLYDPTIDLTDTTNPLVVYQANGIRCAPTFTSSTSSGPLYQDCMSDLTVISYSGTNDVTSTINTFNPYSINSQPNIRTTSSGDLQIPKTAAVHFYPSFGTANNASTLTLDRLHAVNTQTPACNYDGAHSGTCRAAGTTGTVAITDFAGLDADFSAAVPTGMAITNAYGLRLRSFDKATNNWSLYSESAAKIYNGGTADIGDAVTTDIASGQTAIVDIAPAVNVTGGTGDITGVLIAPTTTTSGTSSVNETITGIDFSPTATHSGTAGGVIPTVTGLRVAGTSTTSGTAGNSFLTAAIMKHSRTYTSAVASENVVAVTTITDTPTISSSATSGTSTANNNTSVLHNPTFNQTGNGGSMTFNVDYGLNQTGTYTAGTGGTTTVTARKGLNYPEVSTSGAGTVAVTNNIAVDVGTLTLGSTERTALKSNIGANAVAYFLHDTGGAQMATAGKFTTYNGVTAAGTGLPIIVKSAISSNNVTADYTGASYSPPAAAGIYRVSAIVSVSASSSGTLRCTLDWHDSGGNTHAGATVPWSSGGIAVTNPGTLQAVVATNEYFCGPSMITVDNSTSAINLKVLHGGTSETYTAAVVVEQLG